jgi:hypothetical protein
MGSQIPVRHSYDILLLELHTFELEKYLTDTEHARSFYIDASILTHSLIYVVERVATK